MSLNTNWSIRVPVLAGFLTVVFSCAFPTTLLRAGDPEQPAPVPLARAVSSIFVDSELDFGSVAQVDGYVEIGPNDNVVADPNNILFDATVYSAVIRIVGEASSTVSVSFVGGSSGGLSLSHFTTSLGTPPLSVVLGLDGEITFTVGARLTVDGGNTIQTTYSVPFEISAVQQ